LWENKWVNEIEHWGFGERKKQQFNCQSFLCRTCREGEGVRKVEKGEERK
jgi:hypothetical protein